MAYIVVCFWLLSVNEGQTSLTVCPSKLVYHMPCPGCGVTRATLLMLKGHIIDALMLNPNCLFAIIFVFTYPILLIFSVIKKKAYIIYSYHKVDKILRNKRCLITFLVGELIVWAHNIVAGI